MVIILKIKIPNDVQFLLDKLENAGYEAYIVGGCVRDSIMNRVPHDWDICTSARPNEIFEVFKDEYCIPTGIEHGTITVFKHESAYEITTYRIDGKYSDNRHPDSIQFTSNLIEDLKRRDFTINAIAYNLKKGIIDPFNGMRDIKDEQIACVGLAEDRFKEDGLRILRAIRFCAQLNFMPSFDVLNQISNQRYLLDNISKERIHSELIKIVTSENLAIQMCLFPEIFSQIISQFKLCVGFDQRNKYHKWDVWTHTFKAVENAENKDLIIKLAIMFHDIGKPICYQTDDDGTRHFKGHGKVSADLTDNILRNLKFSNKIRESVVQLVFYHDNTFVAREKHIKRWINKLGHQQFLRLLDVREADIKAHADEYIDVNLYQLNEVRKKYQELIEHETCFTLKDLKINGLDLINLGFKEGKEIGRVLNLCFNLVLDGKIENEYASLLQIVNNELKVFECK